MFKTQGADRDTLLESAKQTPSQVNCDPSAYSSIECDREKESMAHVVWHCGRRAMNDVGGESELQKAHFPAGQPTCGCLRGVIGE